MNLSELINRRADWIKRNPYVFSFYKLKPLSGSDVSYKISNPQSATRKFLNAVSRLQRNKGIAVLLTTKLEPYSDTLSFSCAVSEGSNYRFINVVYLPYVDFLNDSATSYRIESRLKHGFDMFSEKLPSVSPASWVIVNKNIEGGTAESLTKYSGFFSFFS